MSLESAILDHDPDILSGSRYAFVTAAYNLSLVDRLYEAAHQRLLQQNIPSEQIKRFQVPGSFEVPYLINLLALSSDYDCLLALGIVIAGDTRHHEVIEETTAQSFQEISIRTRIPVINGIITATTRLQAEQRAGAEINRGVEFAETAMTMAQHKRQLSDLI